MKRSQPRWADSKCDSHPTTQTRNQQFVKGPGCVKYINSVRNLDTLTYIAINVHALQRVRTLHARAATATPMLC